ncbi:hypothetical protein T8A63_15235 [Sulfitobacter sp. OXR-159]|uniref:hypothetical protein n=1 Tax=Sulfitobacter sp. OXR-159 TaxID=3100174 RepID=UPI002AC9E00D|nr:hypothetical protein [Sulfitobacter sp. OXR-159]WPZ28967.1 hypothetical protein T8A63_15235 [Sulfitobacter sp. OXR-159]
MSKTVKLKVTSAFVYEGKIRTKGQTVTMPEADAKPILEREKAVLAKDDDDSDEGGQPAKAPAKTDKAPAKPAKAPAAAGANAKKG